MRHSMTNTVLHGSSDVASALVDSLQGVSRGLLGVNLLVEKLL